MHQPTHHPRTAQFRNSGRSLASAVLVGLLAAGSAGTAHAASPTDTVSSAKPTVTGTATSPGSPQNDRGEEGEGETKDGWLSFTVDGADDDTRVFHSGVPGGGQLISFFQQPGEDETEELTLTFTTDEPVVAARAAALDDGVMAPDTVDALAVIEDGGQSNVTVDSTDQSQTIYLLPEQTPTAADPEDQNLLQKAWATVVDLITGDDDETAGAEEEDGSDHDDGSPDSEGPEETSEPTTSPTSSTTPDDEDCESDDAGSEKNSQETAASDRDPTSGPPGPARPAAADDNNYIVSQDDDEASQNVESHEATQDKIVTEPSAQVDDGSDVGSDVTMENEASGLPFMLGAAGESVASGEYAEALGRDVDIAATWANDNENMVALPQLQSGGEYGDWDKAIDISIGAIDQNAGETWAKAADGAYDGRWTDSLRTMRKLRQDKSGTTYIRFAHEWNGSWFAWSVDHADTEAFKKSWQHFAELAEENFREAKLVMSQNRESNGYEGDWTEAFPGAHAVDVMNVDYYNNWPYAATLEEFESHLDQTDGFGGPKGLAAHADFAASVGLPLSLGEWSGVDGEEGGDSPAFIEGMFDFFTDHAGTGPGDVLYACQFEVYSAANGKFNLLRGGGLPDSTKAYRDLFGANRR